MDWKDEARLVSTTQLNLVHARLDLLYGTTYSEYTKFWSAPPLFLEDEDIFQKSGSMQTAAGFVEARA
jgi:hypothetical protein